MGHFLPFYIRHAAHQNYDGIWLDLEHRAMDQREIQAILALCHRCDIDCMVRTPTLEHSRLYRYLEDGAAGLMIPLVPDADAARRVVEAVKFPPLGNRGFDGAGLDGDYTLDSWKPGVNFIDDANRETFVIVQIETIEAVNNVEEMAAVPGIDGLFIGPGDLGRRLAVADDANKMTLEQVIEKVSAATKRHGKAWAITAGSVDDLAKHRKMGAQLVPWGADFALCRVLEQCRKDIDEVLAR